MFGLRSFFFLSFSFFASGGYGGGSGRSVIENHKATQHIACVCVDVAWVLVEDAATILL